jgi:TrpR-related protein YerC/YecD
MAAKIDFLFEVLAQVKTPAELRQLFDDWLTPRELEELELRIDIARRLYRGDTYEAIQHETGASSTTVSRVRRCLYHGAGGYRTVLDRLSSRA